MNESENSKKDGFSVSKVVRRIIAVVVFLIILTTLVAGGQILLILQIFGWFESMIRSLTGLDILLSKALAAVFIGGLLALPVWLLIFSFLPLPQKNKTLKRFLVLSLFALMFVASFFASRNIFFDSRSGEPMKYYSVMPSGQYKFYSSDGYDPLTGDKLLPINKEVVLKYLQAKKGVEADEIKLQPETIKSDSVVAKSAVAIVADFSSVDVFSDLDKDQSFTKVTKIAEPERVKIIKKTSLPEIKKPDSVATPIDTAKIVSAPLIKADSVAQSVVVFEEEKKNNLRLYAKDTLGIKSVYEYCPVEFRNGLPERVFLCIAAEPMSRDSFEVFLIQPGDKLVIELFEGNHYFTICNMLGQAVYQLKAYQMDRKPVYLAGERFEIGHFYSLAVRPNKNRLVIIDGYIGPTIR